MRENGKTLCTLDMKATATIGALKSAIIEKRKDAIAKGLHLITGLCIPRIVQVIIDGKVEERSGRTQIRNLISDGTSRKSVTITFVRAYAFNSKAEVKQLIYSLDSKTQGQYPEEMMMTALNMAMRCSYDEALTNLYHHTARVFEAIIKGESRMILNTVKHIRAMKTYPTVRAKYQLMGDGYLQKLMPTI